MDDLKNLVERKATRFPRTEGAYERVQRRVTRRHRSRRITAGAVALIVAAVGTTTALRALTSPAIVHPAGVPANEFFSLWPELDRAAASEEQQRVDHGADRWRLDAHETALHFARLVMRWDQPVAGQCPGSNLVCLTQPDPNIRTLYVRPRPGQAFIRVRLERLFSAGDGGIWNVTEVVDPQLSLPLSSGQSVTVPATLTATTDLPSGTHGVYSQWGFQAGMQGCFAYPGNLLQVAGPTITFPLAPVRPGQGSTLESDGQVSIGCSSEIGSGTPTAAPGAIAKPTVGFVLILRLGGEHPDAYPPDIFDRGVLDHRNDGETYGYLRGGVPLLNLTAVPVVFTPKSQTSPTPSSPANDVSSAGLAIWPEHDAVALDRAQALTDAGANRWRVDPMQVWTRFIHEIMGQSGTPGSQQVEPCDCSDAGLDVDTTDSSGEHHLFLHLAQLRRRGSAGIWSITEIRSADVGIESISVGYDHDRISGWAPPGSMLVVRFEYGHERQLLAVEVRTGADGHFVGDFRLTNGENVQVPNQTGYAMVLLDRFSDRHPDAADGFSAAAAISLPMGPYSAP